MAKITKSTTRDGRTMYKIAGTKKYAYSLAKAKEIAAKMGASTSTAGKRTRSPARRAAKKPARRTAALKTAIRKFFLNAPGGGMMYTPAGVNGAKRLLAAFTFDPQDVAEDAGIPARSVSAAFIKAVKADLEYFIADYAHLRKENRAYAKQKRARGETNEPSILGTKRQPRKKPATRKKTTRRNSHESAGGPMIEGYFFVAPPVSRSEERAAREEEKIYRYGTGRPRRVFSGPYTVTQMNFGPIVMPADLAALGLRAPIRPNTVDYLCETYGLTRKEAEAAVRAAADAPTDAWITVRTPSYPRGGPRIRQDRGPMGLGDMGERLTRSTR